MKLPTNDGVRLRHMIEAAQSALTFVAGRNRADLDGDRILLFALLRAVEVVGEAASKVSAKGRATMPTLPWKQMVAMRNRLVHAYFDINTEIVWKTVTEELPPLLAAMRKIAADQEREGDH